MDDPFFSFFWTLFLIWVNMEQNSSNLGIKGSDQAQDSRPHYSLPGDQSLVTLTYGLMALVWGIGTYFLALEFAVNDFWMVVLGVLVFSVPIALSGLYISTISKIQGLTFYVSKGWLYRLSARRIFATIFWSCWAVVTSFLMLLQFHTYTRLEWFAFFLVIPMFWGVFRIIRTLVAREFKPYLVTSQALKITRIVTPILMLMLYVAIGIHFVDLPHYDSLQQAINTRKDAVASVTGSAIVYEMSQFLAYFDGAKHYAIGQFGDEDAVLALTLLALGGFVIFFNACAMLSCLLIPRVEYRRVFIPLSGIDFPYPVMPGRIAAITAIFTFITLFIYLPAFVSIENTARKISTKFVETRLAMDFVVEQIDDGYYLPGTVEEIKQIRLKAAANSSDLTIAKFQSKAEEYPL